GLSGGSAGKGESSDRGRAATTGALPCWAIRGGTDWTASHQGRAAARPAGSSAGPCVVSRVTRWRRDSSEAMWKLRSRPPVLRGQRPPTFTQRIRIGCLRPFVCALVVDAARSVDSSVVAVARSVAGGRGSALDAARSASRPPPGGGPPDKARARRDPHRNAPRGPWLRAT